jgi:hypothetical protein
MQDWDKPYNKIKPPKGYRLIKASEVAILLESNEALEFLGDYSERYNLFLCEKNKKEDVPRVCRDKDGYWDVIWYNLDISDSIGRVVFVKEKENKR